MKDSGILRISEAQGQDLRGATVRREHVRTDRREIVTGIGNVLLGTEEGTAIVSRETVTETERDRRGIVTVSRATVTGAATVSRETVTETERDHRETATVLRMTVTADRDADRANGRTVVMTEEEVTTVFRRRQWRHRSRSAVKEKVRMIIRRKTIAAGMRKREQ